MNPKKLAVLALMGAAFSQQPREKKDAGFEPETKETPEEKAQRLNDAKIRNFHAQGVKQWHYRGSEVWARDKKNADRKAKNKGFI